MKFSTGINVGVVLIMVSLLATGIYVAVNERADNSFQLSDSTNVSMYLFDYTVGSYQVFVNADSVPTLWGESHLHFENYICGARGSMRPCRLAHPSALWLRQMTGAPMVARGDTLYIRRTW